MEKDNTEIYKTDIQNIVDASYVVQILSELFPAYKFNVDLDDADKILRVQGKQLLITDVEEATRTLGFVCERID